MRLEEKQQKIKAAAGFLAKHDMLVLPNGIAPEQAAQLVAQNNQRIQIERQVSGVFGQIANGIKGQLGDDRGTRKLDFGQVRASKWLDLFTPPVAEIRRQVGWRDWVFGRTDGIVQGTRAAHQQEVVKLVMNFQQPEVQQKLTEVVGRKLQSMNPRELKNFVRED